MATQNALNNQTQSDFTVLNSNLRVGVASPVDPKDVNIEKTTVGDCGMQIRNLSADPAAEATIGIVVQAGAGDASIAFQEGASIDWRMGLDNSDSDKWKLAQGAALGTNDIIAIDPSANGNAVFTPLGTGQVVIGTGTPTAEVAGDRIPFSVAQAVVGGTLGAEIFNTDNTNASSRANLNIRVGGTSAGDAVASWIVNSGSSWSAGVDNSASDAWKLSQGLSLGTNDVLTATTAGIVTVALNDLVVSRNSVGTSVVTQIYNTDNTNGASAAGLIVQSGGASGGDAVVVMGYSAANDWAIGQDTSDSEKFKISRGNALGTDDTVRITTAGEVTMPLQPAFFAYLAATATDKTGNGTTYTLGTDALTEVYDQGGDFNTNGTFTSPVTGIYDLRAQISIEGCTIASSFAISIIVSGTSARTYQKVVERTASNLTQVMDISALAKMTAADTATVTIIATGEVGDTDDITGSATAVTFFCGNLVC